MTGQAGRTEEAEELFRRSLAIEEKQMGADHPHVAATLSDLGATALAAGRILEAEGLLTRALSITDKAKAETGAGSGGGGSSSTTAVVAASTLHSLAEAAHKSDRPEEAEGLLKRALAIEEEEAAGHPPGVVVATLSQLAGWACDGGRADEAEGLYRRALALEEAAAAVGESQRHHDVAGTLGRLGKCLSQQQKVEEAARTHRRALEMVEETAGDRSLEVGLRPACLPLPAASPGALPALAGRGGIFACLWRAYYGGVRVRLRARSSSAVGCRTSDAGWLDPPVGLVFFH